MKLFVLIVVLYTSNGGIEINLSGHRDLADCETVAAIIENDYAFVPDSPLISTECREYNLVGE